MTERNPNTYHLSASAIAAFKACPTRYRLGYREGIRQAEDTEALRVGTNWHALHEVYRDAYEAAGESDHGPDTKEGCHEHALSEAVTHLNECYAEAPSWIEPEDWAREQQVLLVSFVAYLWYYSEDTFEYLSQELPFELPIRDKQGIPVSTKEATLRGKIDHVIKYRGSVCALERKSTSSAVADDSDYWRRCRKDTQVSCYAYAMRGMKKTMAELAAEDVNNIGNTLYDVWHKPSMKPKALTQKDTLALIETGEYCGQKFEVSDPGPDTEKALRYEQITVDGEHVEVKDGAKGFAIKETIPMFGARLLADMQERPEFYFNRKEIARTDRDMVKFQAELYNIYCSMRNYAKDETWFENESACDATYRCQYLPICYGEGADKVCESALTPDGYRRIFEVTHNGDPING